MNIIKKMIFNLLFYFKIMDFYISIIVGSIQAIIFNPIDKAIYNSIINNNSLFSFTNWIKPFSGTTNGIYSRIISSGLYFYLLDYTKHMNIYQSSLTVSLITSLTLNPFNIVKFTSYSNNLTTYNSLVYNYKKYGFKFGKIGIESLILRDFVFNIIYLKYKKDNNDLIHNCSIICTASIISSPLHYVRNMKYYNNDSYINIIKCLFKDINNNIKIKPLFIFKQFGIGYGTARTIMGVYSGQLMYSTMKELI
jgi:hypothetical protein